MNNCDSDQAGVVQHAGFRTTHWSVVLAARDSRSPNADVALEQLCRTYWYPLYAFARRSGDSPADAEDSAQGFFAHFLNRKDLKRTNAAAGRFRCYLLTSFKHYRASEWQKGQAHKRGGQHEILSLEAMAEQRYLAEPSDTVSPDRLYERKWAMEILAQADELHRIENAVDPIRYNALKQLQVRDSENESYQDVADGIGLSVAALKSQVSRFRKRYSELVRVVIAQTVATQQEVNEELKHLLKCLQA